jgi:hypothetical protein
MKTIEEKNRMIAIFMGSETRSDIVDDRTLAYFVGDYLMNISNSHNENDYNWFHPDDMEFHTSWDWIMPVVQKIKSIGDKIMDNYELLDELDNALIHAEMKHVYKSVVNIIKYLNKKN